DEGPLEHVREVAAVRPRVHPDAAAGRAWDRARELEAPEPRGTGAVKAHRVGRTAAGAQERGVDLGRREPARELEDETVEAVVGDEQVRAEPDDRGWKAVRRGPAERVLDLGLVLGARERARRAAGAERREPGEEDPFLDDHTSAWRINGPARSTSPAPTVST